MTDEQIIRGVKALIAEKVPEDEAVEQFAAENEVPTAEVQWAWSDYKCMAGAG